MNPLTTWNMSNKHSYLLKTIKVYDKNNIYKSKKFENLKIDLYKTSYFIN